MTPSKELQPAHQPHEPHEPHEPQAARWEPRPPDLIRYWIEFDLQAHRPRDPPPGHVRLDGGDEVWRLLSRGVGVTGYDRSDCLNLIERVLGQPSPAVTRLVESPTISAEFARSCGNVSWRGIWFPPLNLANPVTG